LWDRLLLYAELGWSPDRIAHHLERAGFFGSDARQGGILDAVVLPAISHLLVSGLPFDDYWDVVSAASTLEHCYFQCNFAAGSSREELEDELRTKWLTTKQEVIDETLRYVSAPLAQVDLDLLDQQPDDTTAVWVRELAAIPGVQSIVEKRLARYDPGLSEREDLIDIARFLQTTDFIRLAARRVLPAQQAEDVVARINMLREQAGQTIRRLSSVEMALLLPVESEDLFLRLCLRERRNIINFWLDALPDRAHGRIAFPEWISNSVFGGGARLVKATTQAFPYWLVVLETEPPREFGIGVSPLRREGDRLSIPLVIEDSTGTAVEAPFHYYLNELEHLLDLLLLATVGKLRLDFAWINDGQLELVSSAVLPLPHDHLKECKAIAGSVLRDRFREDISAVREALFSEKLRCDPGAGFWMADNAKSEQMFVELMEGSDAGAAKGQHELWARLAAAKSSVFRLRIERTELHLAGDEDAAEALLEPLDQAERELVLIRQRLRRPVGGAKSHSVAEDKEKGLLAVLGSTYRCFVHLVIKFDSMIPGGWLSAHWCHIGEEGLAHGHTDLSEQSLRELQEVVGGWWLAAERGEIFEPLGAFLWYLGKGVMAPLAKDLLRSGIRHVILCPIWFLDALPLHCAIVGLKGDSPIHFYDLFESVTYAPSARVLQHLHGLGPVAIDRCLAVSYAPEDEALPDAGREVRLLQHLFPDAVILDGAEATPTKLLTSARDKGVIHLACHAEWHPEDYYSSGLRLHRDSLSRGYLPVARILSEGDFRSTRLVTLATCDSGLSLTCVGTVHNYAGIDGACLTCGARSTLSTLWKIDDLAAFVFALPFYATLRRGESVAEAYRAAVNFLRSGAYQEPLPRDWAACIQAAHPGWREEVEDSGLDFTHPYFWGAFKCSGLTWQTAPTPRRRRRVRRQ